MVSINKKIIHAFSLIALWLLIGGNVVFAQSPAPTPKIIFVTSAVYTGNIGGLAGADQQCNNLATAAGLPGKYVAWLSSSTVDAKDRTTQASVPYVRTDGVEIARNFSGLIAFQHENPIDRDENKNQLERVYVWTNTEYKGTRTQSVPQNTCYDWTSMGKQRDLLRARAGITISVQPSWTSNANNPCYSDNYDDFRIHLYCIQQ